MLRDNEYKFRAEYDWGFIVQIDRVVRIAVF